MWGRIIFSGRCEGGAAAPLGGVGMTGLGRAREAGNARRVQEFRSGISRAKTDTRAACPHRALPLHLVGWG